MQTAVLILLGALAIWMLTKSRTPSINDPRWLAISHGAGGTSVVEYYYIDVRTGPVGQYGGRWHKELDGRIWFEPSSGPIPWGV